MSGFECFYVQIPDLSQTPDEQASAQNYPQNPQPYPGFADNVADFADNSADSADNAADSADNECKPADNRSCLSDEEDNNSESKIPGRSEAEEDFKHNPEDESTDDAYECINDQCGQDSDSGQAYHIPEVAKHIPSIDTLRRARNHGWFKQVAHRPKHFHARCTTCVILQQRCVDGWRNKIDVDIFIKEMRAHNMETRVWRDFEINLHNEARFNPWRVIVISYDDTNAIEMPHWTNRPPKHIPKVHMLFVPFNITNHGARENVYVYTQRTVLKKGGNRICTILYHYLRRIKYKKGPFDSVESKQAKARRVILMADNFAENKCNVLFAFLSHLIHLGWFSEIELLFWSTGPYT